MKLRGLAITVAVLAAASAAHFWSDRGPASPAADPRVGRPIGDTDAIAAAVSVRLSDQGKSVALDRDARGTWRVTSYHGLPADFPKIATLAGDIASAKVDRFVTADPARIARLGFKDTHVAFLDRSGRTLWGISLGRAAESGGRFVRLDGDSAVYLAAVNAWIDTEPRNWADAQLTSLAPDDVARVEVGFASGPGPVFTRTSKEAPWVSPSTPPGRRVKTDALASILASIGSLRFSDTSDPSDPLAVAARAHARTLTFTTFKGATLRVTLGRRPEETRPAAPAKAGAKAPEPKPETVPAGPVFATIASSDPSAPVNALMSLRAFQVDEYAFTSLPQKADELFEPAAR
jgi:Domain of unknown function (DUF4340)